MRVIKVSILLIFSIFSTFTFSTTIKIGTLYYDPPFIISPHEGFDIDLSRLICQRLKLSCQIIPLKPDQLYDALKNGQVDLAISGITISPVRKKEYIFSLPYMLSKGQFLTLKKNPIHSIDGLQGTTVGVIHDELSGGVFYNYILHNFAGKFKVNQYDSIEDMFAALSKKAVSAVFLHRSDVNYWNQNSNNLFKLLGPVVPLGEGLAIMALPDKLQLIGQINKVIQQLENDDTYLALYETYFSNE